jgi:YegS/Rv2252/BmrU family lipid kinase
MENWDERRIGMAETGTVNLLILVNTKARSASDESLEALLAQCLSKYRQVRYEIFAPQSVGQLKEGLAARLSRNHIDKLAIVGGDGTVMETLPVMIEHPEVPVGLIPLGTGNLLAKNLNIPLDVEAAIEVVLTGKTLPIDLGKVENHMFAVNAGVGLDAEIIDKTDRQSKKRWGILAYVARGAFLVGSIRQSKIRIEADDRVIRTKALGVMVSNAGREIGGGVCLAPDADATDGLLHGSILRIQGFVNLWSGVFQLLSGRPGRRKDAIPHFTAHKVHIDAKPALKVQADGNLIGETPVTIEIMPQKLNLLVPTCHLS